jgi:hypothetical protein
LAHEGSKEEEDYDVVFENNHGVCGRGHCENKEASKEVSTDGEDCRWEVDVEEVTNDCDFGVGRCKAVAVGDVLYELIVREKLPCLLSFQDHVWLGELLSNQVFTFLSSIQGRKLTIL